ncbi:MAG: hypothetical protein M1469_08940 [Bacteroidetes bacterium]|nr:hypothetical protein [Bacteroidota bacterium]
MDKHKLLQRSLLLVISATVSFSCRTSPTGPQPANSGSEFKITRDGETVLTGSLAGTDTVVMDTTAQPETDYTYKAYRLVNGQVSDTSLPLQVTTLDTTTHDWTFQSWTFGDGNGSMFDDASIIDDTLAYVVGAVYLKDSTGQLDLQPYNVAVWDRKDWRLEKVPFYYEGQALYNPIYSLLVFNSANVWFGTASVIHWDGRAFIPQDNSGVWGPHRIFKMWGTGSSNFYIVGDSGSIARYDGYTWSRVTSGVSSTVNDIWGVPDGANGAPTVFASTLTQGILSLTPTGATSALDWPGGDIGSIWFADTNQAFVGAGNGVYVRDMRGWRRAYYIPQFVNGLRGSNVNNIFAVGWRAFAHFNGSTWQEYMELIPPLWMASTILTTASL